ncbi:MAG: tautomerase family protein [Chloroflexota bacterium]|nr:tautomerase family protein [Chloroflexota bacterium]PLS79309.1 MAG: tautomerase family protein [Chloroflexota bacterium]
MAQVKVYGLKEQLNPIKRQLGDVIHECVVTALALPPDKRFQRFFPLDAADFVFPSDRSERYTIVEISIFAGRSTATKKRLIRLLFERITADLELTAQDLEITIFESPKENWGIRGRPGDELILAYTVEV